jgi:uncharacterized protein YbjQ (UPF0145 family)
MVLANRELTLAPALDGAVPVAVFDLSGRHLRALADALAHTRRVQFAEALDADAVIALRRSSTVSELLHQPAAERHVLRLDGEQAAVVVHAATFYVAERDVEGYQSPEERDRLAALHELTEPLRDLVADLRLAAAHHALAA